MALEVALRLGGFGKAGGTFGDLHDAFLALALLAAGSGDLNAERFGAIEERGSVSGLGGESVDGDGYQSAFASNSALRASATSSAEPSRSSS